MQVSYRRLFTDANGIDFSVVKNHGANCLCLQGNLTDLKRLKKAYLSSQSFYPLSKDNIFEALSVTQDLKNSISTALFAYKDSGFVGEYLKNVSLEQQYGIGRRIGRVLCSIHGSSLSEKRLSQAKLRHSKFLEHLAIYLSSYPHFSNDHFAIDAISMRYDKLAIYRPVIRYGALRHDKILLSTDHEVMLLPSYTYGPGCLCEDFASLECESAGEYPVLCSGIIDGYFKSAVPSAFWMHFAMYCALYSLWKCGQKVSKDPSIKTLMQNNFDRICADFSNFTRPIPLWYSSSSVKEIRRRALAKGLC